MSQPQDQEQDVSSAQSIVATMFGLQNGVAANGKHHKRKHTIPFAATTRQKARRWPLALRFIKGAIHSQILVPVLLHGLFAGLIVFIEIQLHGHLGLPPSIIPSLSIVVGLMLVFRNQTSYNRFWDGRNHLAGMITCVRNLTRMILACSFNLANEDNRGRAADRVETERVVKILIAILFATKNHLRAEWGAFPGVASQPLPGTTMRNSEYADLLPEGIVGFDHKGLGIPLQLTYYVEQYIKRGHQKGWFHAPQASQMTVQVNTLVAAYGKMETIRLTSIPVAHLIHQKQVLALFGMVLPFAMVEENGWWAVPITILVVFTLYGIDGIGTQLEDPFGCDRNDIKMDAIAEDIREEILVLLDEWKRVGRKGDTSEWFVKNSEAEGRLIDVPSVTIVSTDD